MGRAVLGTRLPLRNFLPSLAPSRFRELVGLIAFSV
jgi:hypothetical protein